MAESSRLLELHLRLRPLGVVAAGLITLQGIVLLAIVRTSFWWEDDFLHLLQAREQGLSGDFLLQNYHGHLEPGVALVFWLLSRHDGSSFLLPTLLLVLLSILASALLWLVLTELFGDRPLLLVPLAIYCFTPLSLVAQTWLSAGLEALPLRVFLLATLYQLLRYDRHGGARWWVGSLSTLVMGLLFWEKAVLIAPVCFGVIVLLAWSGRSLRDRRRRARRQRWLWLSHAVVLAAYIVLYSLRVHSVGDEGGRSGSYLGAAGTMLFKVFLPGLLGGPWWVRDAQNTLYPSPSPGVAAFFVLLLAAAVVASFRISGRRAMWPWVLLTVQVAVDVALVLWARSAYLNLVERDARYLLDALPVACICLAAAFLSRRDVDATPAQRRLDTAVTLPVGLAAAVAVTASCLLTTFQLAAQIAPSYAREYVTTMIAQLKAHPGVAVVDAPAPVSVVPMWQSQVLAALGYPDAIGQPGTTMSGFDGFGRLTPVTLPNPDLSARGPDAPCGWHVYDAAVRLATYPSSAAAGSALRLGYLGGEPGLLHLRVDDREQTLPIPAGLGDAWFVIPRAGSGSIEVWVTNNSSGICVSDVTVGTAWAGG